MCVVDLKGIFQVNYNLPQNSISSHSYKWKYTDRYAFTVQTDVNILMLTIPLCSTVWF